MSETIQQADELRGRAVALLLTERTAIDERLKLFGYDGTVPTTQPKPKSCSVCGGAGHTSRNCDKKGTNESSLTQPL